MRTPFGAGAPHVPRRFIGTAAGLGAVLLSRTMKSLLYDVSPNEPRAYALVSLLLLLVAAAGELSSRAARGQDQPDRSSARGLAAVAPRRLTGF